MQMPVLTIVVYVSELIDLLLCEYINVKKPFIVRL